MNTSDESFCLCPKGLIGSVAGCPKHAAKHMGIVDAAANGSRRDLLVALRDMIARQLAGGEVRPTDMASLTKRLMDIVKEIEAEDAAEQGDSVGNAADTPDEAW